MKKNQHGGRRPGAGRPAGSTRTKQTKVMRVPIDLEPQILDLIEDNIKSTLPLYACKVSAGFPSPADEHLEGEVSLQQLVIKQPAATFFVRCQGESMTGAGMHDNDVLVVDRSVEVTDGKVIVAALNGELTVKRFSRKSNGEVWLLPENPAYQPIQVTPEQNFSVWGVVTCVLHYV